MAFEVFYLVCVFLEYIGVDLTKGMAVVLKLNWNFNILFSFVIYETIM